MVSRYFKVTLLLTSDRARELPKTTLRLIAADFIEELGEQITGRLRDATPSRTGQAKRAWEFDTRFIVESASRVVYLVHIQNRVPHIRYILRGLATQIARRVGGATAVCLSVGRLERGVRKSHQRSVFGNAVHDRIRHRAVAREPGSGRNNFKSRLVREKGQ